MSKQAQLNYTTTEKELLSNIEECFKQFRGILFGYPINSIFSGDHMNLVYYATTLIESQRVMRWRLILEEFGPNDIQHMSGTLTFS